MPLSAGTTYVVLTGGACKTNASSFLFSSSVAVEQLIQLINQRGVELALLAHQLNIEPVQFGGRISQRTVKVRPRAGHARDALLQPHLHPSPSLRTGVGECHLEEFLDLISSQRMII